MKKKNVEASDSHIYLIIGLAYSVSDERIAMTRNHAISLPQHPPGTTKHHATARRYRYSVQRSKDSPTLRQVSAINSPPPFDRHNTTALYLIPLYHSQRHLSRFYEAKSYVSPGS